MKDGWKARPNTAGARGEELCPSSPAHTKNPTIGKIFSWVPVAQLFSKELLERKNESIDLSAPGDGEFAAEAQPKENGRDQLKYCNRNAY